MATLSLFLRSYDIFLILKFSTGFSCFENLFLISSFKSLIKKVNTAFFTGTNIGIYDCARKNH